MVILEELGDGQEEVESAKSPACRKKLHEIRTTEDKGQGWVATSKIIKGTRILAEQAMIRISQIEVQPQQIDKIIAQRLRALEKDQQRAFFALHNAHVGRHSPLAGIARTNAISLGSDASEGGIFLEACRINHCCRPNAQSTWNAHLDSVTIHAIRDIEEGEEITISYLQGSESYDERQASLQENFGFRCTCELCSLPFEQRQDSDKCLIAIKHLEATVGDGTRIVSTPLVSLRAAYALLQLLKDEGIADGSVARLYYDAMKIVIANGDQARAKIFAQRALAERMILEGDDSPETIRLKRLIDRPTEHRLYRTTTKWLQGAGKIPRSLSEEDFEDWLWGRNE